MTAVALMVAYYYSFVLINNSFSLRTSETSYLLETFSFYSAIRSRAYYSKTPKDDRFVFSIPYNYF